MRQGSLAFLVLVLLYSARSQEVNTAEAQKSLGASVFFCDTYNDAKIGPHVQFSAFAELPLSAEAYLKIQLEYFQTNKSSSPMPFEYRGVTYYAQEPQLWRSFGFMMSYMKSVTMGVDLGAGVGVDLVQAHRITLSPGQNHWMVDRTTDTPQLLSAATNDQTAWVLKPAFSVQSDAAWPVSPSLSVVLGLAYKLTFVGEDYGHGSLNTLNAFSIGLGMKFLLE